MQHKGGVAKIYRAKNRDRLRYEVRYHDPQGSLQRDTFDEHAAAQKHANVIVKQLASGELPFLPLRGRERFIYERALDLLAPTGLALDTAIAQLVEAMTKLKGVSTLREAAELSRNHHTKCVASVPVQQAVDEFMEVKKTEGLSHLYLRDLRTRLARFVDYFQCPVAAVTTPDLVRFLNQVGGGRRNRRNHLTTIGTLFNHCKMMGHLSEQVKCAEGLMGVRTRATGIRPPQTIFRHDAEQQFGFAAVGTCPDTHTMSALVVL